MSVHKRGAIRLANFDKADIERTISATLSAGLHLSLESCRAQGISSSIWEDVAKAARGGGPSNLVHLELALRHAGSKGQRALQAQICCLLVEQLRLNTRSNLRLSADDLDDALFSMIQATTYINFMGETPIGSVELAAKAKTQEVSSASGGTKHCPSEPWARDAEQIFNGLWDAGERLRTNVQWAARIRKEAESQEKGSTNTWPGQQLDRRVSGWKKLKLEADGPQSLSARS